MKRIIAILLSMILVLSGCQRGNTVKDNIDNMSDDTVQIALSDASITVNGENISSDTESAVYAANDIVYYMAGQDFTYGKGTEADEHEADEANAHTVVHITRAGTYTLSGTLSAGQIAVDLGDDAESDPSAVVTLIFNGVDISCSVAPAVIFYNVYECGNTDSASETVDTTAAGANVIIADGTVNNIAGSYVARIYKSDTVVLSDDGTEVEDAKKLHKYDGAFYSKMSMNIDGNDGILNIIAENEGLDSELHLTVNGGEINIKSGNDGINTNEDGVSVTTINGGILNIEVTGETGEGDGIDSNGWLVINGGVITSAACSISGDSGLDSDMGIYINGGTVTATGNMFDTISGGSQNFAAFSFAERQTGGNTYIMKNSTGDDIITVTPVNDFAYLVIAGDELVVGDYSFYCGDTQLTATTSQSFGGMSGQMPENMELPEGMELPENMELPGDINGQTPPENMELPEGMELPENMELPEGMNGQTQPANMEIPEGSEIPEGMTAPGGEVPTGTQRPEMPENMELPEGAELPNGEMPQGGQSFGGGHDSLESTGELSEIFTIVAGGNYFANVSAFNT